QRLVGRPGPDSLGMAFLDLAIEPGERLVRFLSAPRPGTSIRERVRLRAANGEVRAVEILLQHRTSDEFATAVEGCLRTVDGAPPEPAARRDVLDRLTSKEQEIVLLLLEGHRVRGIASQLFLSQHTVRNHLKRIFRKLGVSSQGELVARCRAGG
ncbi:MAG: helix-turn-helix transcriptional regulator, partial [Ilumatobacteraceae bacterium]